MGCTAYKNPTKQTVLVMLGGFLRFQDHSSVTGKMIRYSRNQTDGLLIKLCQMKMTSLVNKHYLKLGHFELR